LVLAEAFTRAGYLVLEASNGMSALRLARQALPELVVLDVALAEITGREVLDLLRADVLTRGITSLLVGGASQGSRARVPRSLHTLQAVEPVAA